MPFSVCNSNRLYHAGHVISSLLTSKYVIVGSLQVVLTLLDCVFHQCRHTIKLYFPYIIINILLYTMMVFHEFVNANRRLDIHNF